MKDRAQPNDRHRPADSAIGTTWQPEATPSAMTAADEHRARLLKRGDPESKKSAGVIRRLRKEIEDRDIKLRAARTTDEMRLIAWAVWTRPLREGLEAGEPANLKLADAVRAFLNGGPLLCVRQDTPAVASQALTGRAVGRAAAMEMLAAAGPPGMDRNALQTKLMELRGDDPSDPRCKKNASQVVTQLVDLGLVKQRNPFEGVTIVSLHGTEIPADFHSGKIRAGRAKINKVKCWRRPKFEPLLKGLPT